MAIEQQDLKKIAELSKIEISEENFKDFELKIKNIINLIDELISADVSNIEPKAQPLDQKQMVRKDAVTEKTKIDYIEKTAPEIKDSHYKLPKFVE